MEIYLIRHTETVAEKGICYGQSDVSLKEPFDAEFDRIVTQLMVVNPIVYSSPLIRCQILANHICSKIETASPVITDHRLKELNFGEWELQKWDDIHREILDVWMNDFVNAVPPNGESFANLHKRVGDFITTSLHQKTHTQPVVIVAHAGVIRSFLCQINNVALEEAFNLKVEFGEVIKVIIE